jgi:integrase
VRANPFFNAGDLAWHRNPFTHAAVCAAIAFFLAHLKPPGTSGVPLTVKEVAERTSELPPEMTTTPESVGHAVARGLLFQLETAEPPPKKVTVITIPTHTTAQAATFFFQSAGHWEISMTNKRGHGEGTIVQRGENTFRLRYRVNSRRFTKTVHGTMGEARKELRKLLGSGDTGEHVDPSKTTVAERVEEWITAGAPGRKKKRVGQRALERYEQLLNTHVKPTLGKRPLQQLRAPEIDKLYIGLDGKVAPRTAHHVHVVLGACLATAHRKGLIAANPMLRVEQIPNTEQIPDDGEEQKTDFIGEGLSEAELSAMLSGFKSSMLYPVVALAAATGARRNELLALRWSDFDAAAKSLRIERALDQTKKFGIRVKPPKTKRGFRTIDLDDATVAVLVTQREKLQRVTAGIPAGAAVDLALVRLPSSALMFPAVPMAGEDFDIAKPCNPRNFSKEFARKADWLRETARKAGLPSFAKTRFHDLRGIHATALLDAGIPVHTVAQRIGDDPAILLRNYAKRKRSKQADKSLTAALNALSSGFHGS